MIQIKNLTVKKEDKEILKDLNLSIEKGTVNVIMGPNGSGKSTLAHVIMGDSGYNLVSGRIIFNGNDITDFPVNERAKLGIFLSFQNPVEVDGVTVFNFLRQAYNTLDKHHLTLMEFKKLLEKEAEGLGIEKTFLQRYLNKGFSGGEKKKLEILQLLVLQPEFAVLDETDSGLDIDALKLISKGINSFKEKGKTILLITHYKRILDHIHPDKVFVMFDGKIVKEGNRELVEQLEEKGYSDLEYSVK